MIGDRLDVMQALAGALVAEDELFGGEVLGVHVRALDRPVGGMKVRVLT